MFQDGQMQPHDIVLFQISYLTSAQFESMWELAPGWIPYGSSHCAGPLLGRC